MSYESEMRTLLRSPKKPTVGMFGDDRPGVGEIQFERIRIRSGLKVETCEIEAVMHERGLRPATHAELVRYHAEKRPFDPEHPMVALGSVAWIDGEARVAGIWMVGNLPGIVLIWRDCQDGWNSCGYDFLAVRENRPATDYVGGDFPRQDGKPWVDCSKVARVRVVKTDGDGTKHYDITPCKVVVE